MSEIDKIIDRKFVEEIKTGKHVFGNPAEKIKEDIKELEQTIKNKESIQEGEFLVQDKDLRANLANLKSRKKALEDAGSYFLKLINRCVNEPWKNTILFCNVKLRVPSYKLLEDNDEALIDNGNGNYIGIKRNRNEYEDDDYDDYNDDYNDYNDDYNRNDYDNDYDRHDYEDDDYKGREYKRNYYKDDEDEKDNNFISSSELSSLFGGSNAYQDDKNTDDEEDLTDVYYDFVFQTKYETFFINIRNVTTSQKLPLFIMDGACSSPNAELFKLSKKFKEEFIGEFKLYDIIFNKTGALILKNKNWTDAEATVIHVQEFKATIESFCESNGVMDNIERYKHLNYLYHNYEHKEESEFTKEVNRNLEMEGCN